MSYNTAARSIKKRGHKAVVQLLLEEGGLLDVKT